MIISYKIFSGLEKIILRFLCLVSLENFNMCWMSASWTFSILPEHASLASHELQSLFFKQEAAVCYYSAACILFINTVDT